MTVMRLATNSLTRHHGGVKALDGVDIEVAEGEVLVITGGNGAGKSTLLDLLSGVTRPTSGTITVDGRQVVGGAGRFARLGVVRSFQTTRLVDELSVDENVALGAVSAMGRPLGLMLIRRRPAGSRTASAKEAVGLDIPGFRRAAGLSGGERKRLELARILAGRPRVALLDEPLAGVAQQDRASVVDAARVLADRGAGVIVVEHDLAAVSAVADRVLTLERGRVVTS